jgi:hypothetical protein
LPIRLVDKLVPARKRKSRRIFIKRFFMRFAAGSATLCSLLFNFGKQPDRQAFNIQHSTPNTEQRIVPIVNHCGPGEPGVGQTFQSAGSRNFPVPCFHLRATGQVRMWVASRMNGRLESRPTGRLESLPYKSERLAFSCGCLFPHLPSWPCAAAGTPCGGTRPTKKS